MKARANIVENAMTTAYGSGLQACWRELLAGHSAVAEETRFAERDFISRLAASAPRQTLDCRQNSRLKSILAPVLDRLRPRIPTDAAVLLATTVGEIDLLETEVLRDTADRTAGDPMRLLTWVRERVGLHGSACLVSAACASSSLALARAAAMVESGQVEAVLAVGCDTVSEFTFAGFSALQALSPNHARPFDRERDGLNLGEAAVATLVVSPQRARRESRQILGSILGYGIAGDANHMTGPARDGEGLRRATLAALHMAEASPEQIDLICAHGTGTLYNDAMELQAFRRIFGSDSPPLFSVKGGTGHTLGAAGLLEALVTAQALREKAIPPTVGLQETMPEAAGLVRLKADELPRAECAISTNSGFGGINCALVLG